MESGSKANSEKAQGEPEPLIYPADDASAENASLDLTIPEPTTPEQIVNEEEQHYTEQQDGSVA